VYTSTHPNQFEWNHNHTSSHTSTPQNEMLDLTSFKHPALCSWSIVVTGVYMVWDLDCNLLSVDDILLHNASWHHCFHLFIDVTFFRDLIRRERTSTISGKSLHQTTPDAGKSMVNHHFVNIQNVSRTEAAAVDLIRASLQLFSHPGNCWERPSSPIKASEKWTQFRRAIW